MARDADLLAFIQAYFDLNGYAPSYNEMVACRVRIHKPSRNGTMRTLASLERDGYIKVRKFKWRSIEILKRPLSAKSSWAWIEKASAPPNTDYSKVLTTGFAKRVAYHRAHLARVKPCP